MLYLEDYLEMIEHLPQELRDRFTEMREMDLQVNNTVDSIESEVKNFFSNAKRMKVDQRDLEYDRIRSLYERALERCDEKVELASDIYETVEKYLKRLESELAKFKLELEADNSGITEMLEKRSLELDTTSSYPNNVLHHPHHLHHNHHSHHHHHHHHHEGPATKKVKRPKGSGAHTAPILPHGDASMRLNPFDELNNYPYTNSSSANRPPLQGLNTPLTAAAVGGSAAGPSSAPSNYLNDKAGPLSSYMPTGSSALAAAASQAIAWTTQLPHGRRTASLKASVEAVQSSGLSGSSGVGRGGGPGRQSLGNKRPKGSQMHPSHGSLYGPNGSFVDGFAPSFDDSNEPLDIPPPLNPIEWSTDPNEPRYCICNQVSYGEMVACDNNDCDMEWFHYDCVGIKDPPKGKWYCPPCEKKLKKKRSRKDNSIDA